MAHELEKSLLKIFGITDSKVRSVVIRMEVGRAIEVEIKRWVELPATVDTESVEKAMEIYKIIAIDDDAESRQWDIKP